ncbi:hypothetical protein HFN06_25850 [Rhizobium leguminosarum]|uniref:hypothetical protein n=1 Tax=Rhizobium TaxID=379 RepID=UPI001032500E|nr:MULTISPECIES: hypothetical protein [Rhizobium]MCA2434863.1 hypothetical protein [Rhizobium leguminosarum]NKK09787.1 hypothetical protein [Rhizobium leguminosarum bv. viciae]TAV38910.1 hypothetical protein ELI33_17675 [Rhizobium ruizarguesonis]
MITAIKKRKAKSLSSREMDRLAALFHSGYIGFATPTNRQLKERDAVSFEIMGTFVLKYVSMTRPTIAQVYRCYQAKIARLNIERTPSTQLPVLSKYMFRSAVDALDPFFVMAGRHGLDAAMRYLRRSRLPQCFDPSIKPVPLLPLAS